MIEALNAMTKSVELAASALDVMADLVEKKTNEIERLRAVIERVYQSSNQPHIIEMTRAALEEGL